MDHPDSLSLALVPADRRLIDRLFARGLVSLEARAAGLDLVHPTRAWALWAARLLLVLGVALVLAGSVFFFAFNWARLTTLVKLGSVELALVACLAGSFRRGFRGLPGRLLLLSASLLVGVFLAVFGQIYQTGADAYTLFLSWAGLILPWVLIGCFAPLWVLWLVVANLALGLYWDQAAHPDDRSGFLIFTYLILFNGAFLALREALAGRAWLAPRWTRLILVLPLLVACDIPAIAYIADPGDAAPAIGLGAALALAVHGGLFLLYRYRRGDLWALAALVLSLCILVEAVLVRVVFEFGDGGEAGLYLFLGLATLGVFTGAIVVLRIIAKAMDAAHAR